MLEDSLVQVHPVALWILPWRRPVVRHTRFSITIARGRVPAGVFIRLDEGFHCVPRLVTCLAPGGGPS